MTERRKGPGAPFPRVTLPGVAPPAPGSTVPLAPFADDFDDIPTSPNLRVTFDADLERARAVLAALSELHREALLRHIEHWLACNDTSRVLLEEIAKRFAELR